MTQLLASLIVNDLSWHFLIVCSPGDIEVAPRFGPAFSKRYVALTGLIIGVGEIIGQIFLSGQMKMVSISLCFRWTFIWNVG